MMDKNIYQNYYWQDSLIRLRLCKPDDITPMYENDLDSEALGFVQNAISLPHAEPEQQTWQPAVCRPEAPSFSIETLNGEYAGHIHFNYIDERHGTFSIGLIVNAPYRGKGIGKSAMRLLLDYAFFERRLNKYNGHCMDINAASAALHQSLGCVLEGTLREAAYYHGKYRNILQFGLTASEYRAMRDEACL